MMVEFLARRVELASRQAAGCSQSVEHVRQRLGCLAAEAGLRLPPLDVAVRAPSETPDRSASPPSSASPPRRLSPHSPSTTARPPRTPEPRARLGGRGARRVSSSGCQTDAPACPPAVRAEAAAARGHSAPRPGGVRRAASAPNSPAPQRATRGAGVPSGSEDSGTDGSDADDSGGAALDLGRGASGWAAAPPPLLSSWRRSELGAVLERLGLGEAELAHALLTLGCAEQAEYAQLQPTQLALLAAVFPSAYELRAARRRLDALCAAPARARAALRSLCRPERFLCALTALPLPRERVACWAFAASFAPNADHAAALVRRMHAAAQGLLGRGAWLRELLRLLGTAAHRLGAAEGEERAGAAGAKPPAVCLVLAAAAADEAEALAALGHRACGAVRLLCAPAGGPHPLGEMEAAAAEGALAADAQERARAGSAWHAAPGCGEGKDGGGLVRLLARLQNGVLGCERALRRYGAAVGPGEAHPDDGFERTLRPFAARAQREHARLAHELAGAAALCARAAPDLFGAGAAGAGLGSPPAFFTAVGCALRFARAVLAAEPASPDGVGAQRVRTPDAQRAQPRWGGGRPEGGLRPAGGGRSCGRWGAEAGVGGRERDGSGSPRTPSPPPRGGWPDAAPPSASGERLGARPALEGRQPSAAVRASPHAGQGARVGARAVGEDWL